MNTASRELWWRWLVVLLWSGIISLQSADMFSSRNTGQLLYSVLLGLGLLDVFGPIDWARVTAFNANLRIAGHLVGYGVLSCLAFGAWRASLRAYQSIRGFLYSAALAMVLTAAVAALDEFHQSFLPSRSGSIRDVLLDCAAAAVVQCFMLVQFRCRRTAPLPNP